MASSKAISSLDGFKRALVLIAVGLLAVLAASVVVIAMVDVQRGKVDQMGPISKRQDTPTPSTIADMQAQIAQLTTTVNALQSQLANGNLTLSPNGKCSQQQH